MICRFISLRSYYDYVNYHLKVLYNNKKLFVIYFITFILILPWLLHDVPNSLYFTHVGKTIKSAQADIRKENDRRLVQTDQFLKNFISFDSKLIRVLDVSITVITVSRNRNTLDSYQPRYLTQTIASLLKGLRKSNYNITISICNVDKNPSSYREAIKMNKYVERMFTRFSDHRYVEDLDPLEKEKQDYVYCINETLKHTGEANVFILEDDALPHADMFSLLEHTLEYRLTPERSSTISYVKFFHPQWLLGFWSLDSNRIASLWAASTLLGILAFLIESHFTTIKAHNVIIRLTLWCLYFTFIFIAIG